MPITGPSSYIPTINEFLSHWTSCNAALPPATPFLVRLPETNTTVTRAQFLAQRDALLAQQNVVQSSLTDHEIARGAIQIQKATLLTSFSYTDERVATATSGHSASRSEMGPCFSSPAGYPSAWT